MQEFLEGLGQDPPAVPELVKTIRSSRELFEVASAFVGLRTRTGVRFRMFDFDAVEKWCKEQGAVCNQP